MIALHYQVGLDSQDLLKRGDPQRTPLDLDLFDFERAHAAKLAKTGLDSIQGAERVSGGELARTLVTHPSVDSTASITSA